MRLLFVVFFVARDDAVGNSDNTSCFLNHTLIVGGKDEGDILFFIQLFHNIEQVGRGFAVEIGRGFIGKDEFGL